jgi:methylglutaconyl-CoA hydratase
LTLDEASNKNALSPTIIDGLVDALAQGMDDASVRVVVITNEGNTFCAGADLRSGGSRGKYGITTVLAAIQDAPKPVVGRIAGHCVAGGVGIAAACDISVVVDNAVIGFSEVRIGVAPAIISVVCLPKLSRADASELMLTGRRITGVRAAEIGLLNHAVPADLLDAKVDAVVADLVAGGPAALSETKRLIASVPDMARDEAFAKMSALSHKMFASLEGAEGMAAFRERRPASWVPADR